MNPVLAAMVLSMLATPFIIMYSNRIVMKLVASDWLQQSVQMTTIARKSINTSKHVIICGYGRCGQNLARMLEQGGIPYMALDLDPDRVRQAAAAGRLGGVWRRHPPAGADGRRPGARQRRGGDLHDTPSAP
jgi:CPA2 family monovalent cation:H+ antiporter-2